MTEPEGTFVVILDTRTYTTRRIRLNDEDDEALDITEWRHPMCDCILGGLYWRGRAVWCRGTHRFGRYRILGFEQRCANWQAYYLPGQGYVDLPSTEQAYD